MAQLFAGDPHLLIACKRSEDRAQVVAGDAAAAQMAAILVARQVAASAEQLPAMLDGLFEGQRFHSMKRVVVDERAHGPVLRNDFTGQLHVGAQLHPLGIGEPFRRSRHRRGTLPKLGGWAGSAQPSLFEWAQRTQQVFDV